MDTVAKLNIGFVMTVLGMGVVFCVLIFLAYTFKLMEIIFKPRPKKETSIKIVEGSTQDAGQGAADQSAVIAVITAAIAACDGGKSPLVVRSIARVGDTVPSWGRMGRQDQMASRMIG